MTTSSSSSLYAALLRKHNIVVAHLTLQSFFDAFHVIYKLSEIKDDIQVVSQFLCLLRHPVRTRITICIV